MLDELVAPGVEDDHLTNTGVRDLGRSPSHGAHVEIADRTAGEASELQMDEVRVVGHAHPLTQDGLQLTPPNHTPRRELSTRRTGTAMHEGRDQGECAREVNEEREGGGRERSRAAGALAPPHCHRRGYLRSRRSAWATTGCDTQPTTSAPSTGTSGTCFPMPNCAATWFPNTESAV